MPAAAFDDTDGFEALDGANEVAMVQISGRTYAAVISDNGDSMQVMCIRDPYGPTQAAAIRDGGFTDLYCAEDAAAAQTPGRTHAVVNVRIDDGVQIIRPSRE